MKLSYILNSLHIKWNNWFFCLNFDDYSLHLMKIKQYRDAYFLFKQDLEPARSAKTNSKASEGINPDDTLSRAWIDWNTGGWWMGPWLGTTGRCQQGTRVCSLGWESLTLELELHRLGPLSLLCHICYCVCALWKSACLYLVLSLDVELNCMCVWLKFHCSLTCFPDSDSHISWWVRRPASPCWGLALNHFQWFLASCVLQLDPKSTLYRGTELGCCSIIHNRTYSGVGLTQPLI